MGNNNFKKIRLFYWGIHDVSLLRDICDKLFTQKKLDMCVCIPMGTNNTRGFDNEYFKVIESFSLDENRIECLKYNDEDPLEKSIIEKMLPYESRAIELGMRRINVPIVEYTREQQRYYSELRRIYNIFKKHGINSYFASAVPHYQDAFIGYCLAKINEMPVRFFTPSGELPNRRIIAEELGNIGESIANRFHKILVSDSKCTLWSKDLIDYFETQSLPMSSLRQIKNPGKDKATSSMKNDLKKTYWGVWSKHHRLYWNPITRYLKRIYEMAPFRKDCAWDKKGVILNNLKEEHALVHYYMKYYKFTLEEYNKMATIPNYEKPFILFALQFVPEASTTPQAGAFSSQYISIQLLAKCAKEFDCDVYVKEHGHLAMRNKHFYDEISLIPNVKFIKTSISTYELMEKSIAVSSQTGSCLLEAVLQGVPAIAMGNGYLWKSLPGLYEVGSFKDGTSIIKRILNGDTLFSKEEVYKYMCAIDIETVYYNTNAESNSDEYVNNIKVMEKILNTLYEKINL